MPGKTITVFNYGYTSELTGVNSYIDYGIYAFFNYPSWGTDFGMPNSKWAPLTINLNSTPSASSAQLYATQVANKGFGAIGYYDLRANNIVLQKELSSLLVLMTVILIQRIINQRI